MKNTRYVIGYTLSISPLIVLLGIATYIIAQRIGWLYVGLSYLAAIVVVAVIWIGVELMESSKK